VSAPSALPLVAIPALLCDEALYRDVLTALHDGRDTRVMVASHPEMRDSVAAILDAAPERFVLAGSSYGGTVAIEVALAAPERVAALWLNGCDPGATNRDGNLGLASLLETATEAAVGYLASVVVRPQASAAADAFRDMAHRTGGTVGGAQARALAARTDAWDRLAALTMPTLRAGRGDPRGRRAAARGRAAERPAPRAARVRAPADARAAPRGRGPGARVDAWRGADRLGRAPTPGRGCGRDAHVSDGAPALAR
jgi:pimeloyl-ACP methyl ester carboxylesterase